MMASSFQRAERTHGSDRSTLPPYDFGFLPGWRLEAAAISRTARGVLTAILAGADPVAVGFWEAVGLRQAGQSSAIREGRSAGLIEGGGA